MKLYPQWSAGSETNLSTDSLAATSGQRNLIGAMNDVTGQISTNTIDGMVDEFRVWRMARTAGQIRDTMGTRIAGHEPGLVGLWNFDDPANPGRDASPGGHHGKLMGQATITNAALPVVVSGTITDAASKPLANATVEIHQAGQPDRRVTANAAGEYAFTMNPSERGDLFATDGERSAIASVSNPAWSHRSAWTGC